MAINNHSYEEQTQRLLAETLSELKGLEAKREELDNNIATLKAEAQAYEIVLQGYRRRVGKQTAIELDWGKLLEGQIHKQKLVTIAEHNSGKIRVNQATDLLYSKGFIKSKKRTTAYTMIQGLLADMAEEGTFEKTAPGEYRLVAKSS